MNSIEKVNEIMANFLGIEKKRRVKRFWQAALTFAAPYILEPLGKEFSKFLFGNNMDNERLDAYGQEIAGLRNSQQDLANQLQYQRTMFLIDSEKKGNQINYLKRCQDGIKNDLKMLESSVSLDSAEKDRKIKELNEMLANTDYKLGEQQQKLTKVESDVEDIKVKVIAINDDLKKLREDVTVNRGNIKAVEIETKLNSLSINFNFLLTRFETEQKTLLDVIKNANRGFLDPYIVTPVNLIEMMRNVESMLPEQTRFPFHPDFMNAASLYTIIEPTVYLHKNKIMFILRMPLVHASTFEVYKMTSVPMFVSEDKFVFILPNKDYLFINDHHDPFLEYVLTSASDFREFCREVGKNKFICEQIQQTSGLSSNLRCEVQLFLNRKGLSSNCDTRVVKLEKTLFFQLQKYGHWIYLAPKSETVVLSCGNKRQNEVIKGAGILYISNNCTARTSDLVLKSIIGSKPRLVTKVYMPETAVQIDQSLIESYDETAPSNHKQVMLQSDRTELESISTNINDIGNTAKKSSVNYTLAIIVVVIIVAVTLLMIVYRKKICRWSGHEEIKHSDNFIPNNLTEEKMINVKLTEIDAE
ncbi:unnamed protein product [Phaedon cochleariae]|uniref:t-SNARE coiled-coil homology domain-containing protein n=1 Tax=Phaedon cochleariae TaxID=80249 RepID=A0A9N9SGR9_PHACE|nr:unnamed protein product [Phaedon cochleariae]